MEWLAKGFLYAWLFCTGATVGSFLNVVVYRLPRGKNLAYPGSYCPRCGHAIRLNDNIPILSWLALSGRCRDCGGRISPRYFFVELATATMFLIVLACEHYLPAGALGFTTRRLLTPYDSVPFWCMYAVHVGLMTTLLVATLILSDGHRLSPGVFLPIGAVAFVLPLIWPEIRSVPAFAYGNDHVWWNGLVDGLAGAAMGAALGGLAGWWWRRLGDKWPAFAPLAWSCAVGIVLGWQRTIYVLPASVVACMVAVQILKALRRPDEAETSEPQTTGGADFSGESLESPEEKGPGVFGGRPAHEVEAHSPPKTPDPT